MLKRFDVKINHDLGECLYTVEAESAKTAIGIVTEQWHKDHIDYNGTNPKFSISKNYTYAEKKALGGVLLGLIGGMYLHKVYSNKIKPQKNMSNKYSKGGNVEIYKQDKERLGRPNSEIEKDILERVQFDENSFVGNMAWRTPSGKLALAYLFALDEFDKNLVKDMRLKDGEKIYRYFNRTTAIGGMQPMIKINVDKGLIYFTQEMENPDYDEIKFETRGIKPVWINLIEGKFEKGGNVKEWIYWKIEVDGDLLYAKTHPASPNIPNGKRISKEEYDANINKYAKGGTVENLTKELHKLQRELNSPRLSTYREGDNSSEEQARKKERESKLARFNEVLKLLNQMDGKYAEGGKTLQMTITKDEFFQRPNEPHRVYHEIEGLYGTYWFKAKTENSHKFGYGSDGINNGGVYQLSVWRGGHPVGRDVSTLGGHVSEDHIASYFNKWEYRSKTKVDKQIVNEIVNWLEANIVDLKRPYTSVKFAVGGNFEEEISYIDRRIKNLKGLLSVSNSDEAEDIQKSIDSLEREKSKLTRSTQYAKGGITFSDAEQADFDFWIEDGNVSQNPDGSYSTQDTGWRNNLKDLSALKQYYVKEFLSGSRYATGGGVGFNDDVFDATKLDLDNEISSRVYYKGVDNQINKILQNNYKPIFDFDKNGIEWVYNNTRFEVKEEDLISELKEALAMRNRGVVDMMRINNELPRIESRYGKDVNFAKKMYQEAKDFYQNKLRNEKAIKANEVLIDYLISRLKENKKSFATGGGVPSSIKTGDWVTLKSDGKRYKVKRVLSNNMIEIVAGTKTLTVSINDVDTNVKFFRSKFVAVPSTVQVKFKVGDRVQFNTKKGITEVGKVLLYKYIPTKNTIIYTIATDSGWKASVLQENLLPDGAQTPNVVKVEKTTGGLPPKEPKQAQAKSALKVGDKIEIIGAPNLTGTVTKVLSSTNEIEVLLSDSFGIAVKMGKSIPFTYSESKVNKI